MALSDTQLRQLKAKLDGRYVKTRKSDGAELSYVEGWHVIAEANRIFGYDAWDRRTVATSCVSSSGSGQHHVAAYTAKVRITVRAGDTVVVREGSGTGEGIGVTAGQAHEVALKSAETDATKRALSTFGNPFGLALYDREQLGVRRCRDRKTSAPSGPWILRSASGAEQAAFERPAEFAARLREAMSEANDIELLFAIWEQNVETVRGINRSLSSERPRIRCRVAAGGAPQAVRRRPREAQTPMETERPRMPRSRQPAPKIDKSALTIGETRRIRCREHLRFVASQPCVVCGRTPSHAHHVRHAQPRGLGLKVSDEFAVPLCATHHHHLHQTTKEQDWWQERKIDPLVVARRLWRETRDPSAAAVVASASDPVSAPPSSEVKPTDGVLS